MELIAHRGAPNRQFAENSKSAFLNALHNGFRTLEFDLRLTLDDRFVVLHDATPRRTCSGPPDRLTTPIRWQDRESLTGLFFKDTRETIPSFQELLNLLELYPDLTLFPELKDSGPAPARGLLEILKDHPNRDRVVVQSFEHRQLQLIRESSDIKVCPLYKRRSASVEALDCEWEAPMAEMLLFDPTAVAGAHAAGRKVAAWFLIAQGSGWLRRKMERLGVDALMIDTFTR